MFDTKPHYYNIYLGYLFTAYEYKHMTLKIHSKNNEVYVLKLHKIIKLNNEKVTCELDIETVSYYESDDATNVCWANSIIKMVLDVILPVYKDLYTYFCYKVQHENIDINNQDHKSHVLIFYQLFKVLNNYIKRYFGQV